MPGARSLFIIALVPKILLWASPSRKSVLCQHQGSLMPKRCWSFGSNLEQNVSLPHLHCQFDEPLPPCSLLFRIGLMIHVRLDLLRLELFAVILGLLDDP